MSSQRCARTSDWRASGLCSEKTYCMSTFSSTGGTGSIAFLFLKASKSSLTAAGRAAIGTPPGYFGSFW